MKKDFIVRQSITMVEGKPHVETYSEQEIVRCKDCKKYGDNKKCPIEALINSDSKQFFAFDENWFCADGERRGDSG